MNIRGRILKNWHKAKIFANGVLVTFLLRKRKEKKQRYGSMQIVMRTTINSTSFDIIMRRFCDLRPGDTQWVIINADGPFRLGYVSARRYCR